MEGVAEPAPTEDVPDRAPIEHCWEPALHAVGQAIEPVGAFDPRRRPMEATSAGAGRSGWFVQGRCHADVGYPEP